VRRWWRGVLGTLAGAQFFGNQGFTNCMMPRAILWLVHFGVTLAERSASVRECAGCEAGSFRGS